MNNAVVRGLAGLRRAVAGPDYPRVRAPGRPAGKLARFGPPLAVLALLGLLLITYQYLWSVRGINLMAWALAALTVAPAALMLDRPLLAWRLCIVGGVVGTGWATAGEALPWNPVQVFVTLAVLVVVALRADRVVVFWVGLITVFVAFYFVPDPASFYGLMLLVAALLAIGSSFRRVRQVEGELAEQAGVTEREQARRGLLEERARIARELHDVVAHHMSLLAVRAETAPYRLPDLPEPARVELAELAQAARDALTDLRRLLGVLRSEDAGPELAPQPDLDAVADLVEATRRAGVAVSYLAPEPPVEGARRPPGPVALAGFRIVQEALANASRHAPGAPVTVQVWPGTADLAVRVHNAAPPAPADAATPAGSAESTEPAEPAEPGHGLTGMRERAAALGGEFRAGPTTDGGYSVVATLPYDTGEDGDRV